MTWQEPRGDEGCRRDPRERCDELGVGEVFGHASRMRIIDWRGNSALDFRPDSES
jgi:hypothetical protein